MSRVLPRGAVFALALFGAASHVFLGADAEVPDWLLPAAVAAGLAIAMLARRSAAAPIDEPVDRRVLLAACAILAVTFGFLVYGSCATPSRDWDGATSWDLRARALTETPTLAQPFFRDGGVFAHSRDYPLLQPLVLAALARLGPGPQLARIVFPLLWLLFLTVVLDAWRTLGLTRRQRIVFGVACALTPMLVDPAMGSIDSGFGDAALMCTFTILVAGLATDDLAFITCGALLLPMVKPEGLLLAPLTIAVAWMWGRRRALIAALIGFDLGVLLWLPLYFRLVAGEAAYAVVLWLCAAISVPVGWSALLLERSSPRRRAGAAVVLVALGTLAAWALTGFHPMGVRKDGVLDVYLAGLRDLPSRLPKLPGTIAAIVGHAFTPRRFGMLAPLLLVLAFTKRHSIPAARLLATLLALCLASLVLPFVTSPEQDLQHHVNSSLDRLLMQQVGLAWLLAGLWWNAAVAQPVAPVVGDTR